MRKLFLIILLSSCDMARAVGFMSNPFSLSNQSSNTVLANVTASTAKPVGVSIPSCVDSGGNHLNYTSGTGFSCGTSGGAGGTTFNDSTFTIFNNADNTKIANFSSSGISTGTTRTFTFPNASTTLLGTNNIASITNKTFEATSNTFQINGSTINATSGSGGSLLQTSAGTTSGQTLNSPYISNAQSFSYGSSTSSNWVIAASGTTYGSSTNLTQNVNFVTASSSSNIAVALLGSGSLSSGVGQIVFVSNTSAYIISVFPPPTYTITDQNGVVGSVGAPYTLNAGQSMSFVYSGSANYRVFQAPTGLSSQSANTALANTTSSSAVPTAVSLPSCTDSGGNHLNYTSGTGFSCGTSSTSAPGGVTLSSGTYTPTLTNTSNVTSTAIPLQYMRVGSVVTVSGKVTATATSPSNTSTLEFSLPVASNMSNGGQDCGGGGGGSNGGLAGATPVTGVYFDGGFTNKTCRMQFTTVLSGAQAYNFSFTYIIN